MMFKAHEENIQVKQLLRPLTILSIHPVNEKSTGDPASKIQYQAHPASSIQNPALNILPENSLSNNN